MLPTNIAGMMSDLDRLIAETGKAPQRRFRPLPPINQDHAWYGVPETKDYDETLGFAPGIKAKKRTPLSKAAAPEILRAVARIARFLIVGRQSWHTIPLKKYGIDQTQHPNAAADIINIMIEQDLAPGWRFQIAPNGSILALHYAAPKRFASDR